MTDYWISEADASVIGKTIFADPIWDELDLGILSRTDIIQDFEQKYPQYKKEISWFLNHGEYMHVPRKDVWKKVHQLKKKGYRIYLLSNYSEDLFRKHTADADFMNDIDGMVVSWQIHKTKPSPEIYLHLLETYELTPSECIFFDDRPANTEAARKLGIQAVTINSKDVLMAELQKL